MENSINLEPLNPDDNPLGLFDKKMETELGIQDKSEKPISEETQKAFDNRRRKLIKTERPMILRVLYGILS